MKRELIDMIASALDPDNKKEYFLKKDDFSIIEGKAPSTRNFIAIKLDSEDFMECMEDFTERFFEENVRREMRMALKAEQPDLSFLSLFSDNPKIKASWEKYKLNWLRKKAEEFLEDIT